MGSPSWLLARPRKHLALRQVEAEVAVFCHLLSKPQQGREEGGGVTDTVPVVHAKHKHKHKHKHKSIGEGAQLDLTLRLLTVGL
jgi:hypothetical protein